MKPVSRPYIDFMNCTFTMLYVGDMNLLNSTVLHILLTAFCCKASGYETQLRPSAWSV